MKKAAPSRAAFFVFLPSDLHYMFGMPETVQGQKKAGSEKVAG